MDQRVFARSESLCVSSGDRYIRSSLELQLSAITKRKEKWKQRILWTLNINQRQHMDLKFSIESLGSFSLFVLDNLRGPYTFSHVLQPGKLGDAFQRINLGIFIVPIK